MGNSNCEKRKGIFLDLTKIYDNAQTSDLCSEDEVAEISEELQGERLSGDLSPLSIGD